MTSASSASARQVRQTSFVGDETQYGALIDRAKQVTHLSGADLEDFGEGGHACTMVRSQLGIWIPTSPTSRSDGGH